MSDKNAKHEIEIKRNPVERMLMKIKNFIKSNKKAAAVFFLILVIISGFVAAGFIYYENVNNADTAKLELLVEKYNEASKSGNSTAAASVINEIIDLGRTSKLGFASKMSSYTAGNFLYNEKKYKEAADMLVAFADKNSSSIFAPLALQKAALALEEAGNIDNAFPLYTRLEKDYSGSIIADQIYYNFGRIYAIKGDLTNAKKYFNMVISSYPQSQFVELAKKRIFMLSYKKN
jgi:tetratricopeptide (TPR) repeat protein